ncbi:type VI secretion system-associated FHA domain protein TagH [Pseudomonas citri]|uniref:type VI secretion system-associated FHA domain protein TagH n=1 Tax=Pseudomonas citri TaxID=2978349 RepID=UPI0021B5BF5E|nr:type VI secretion system-associated FHA domain protein TagH [Pseudomonas citri]
MELVFEILRASQFISTQMCRKTFGPAGGVIGRGEGCDWSIPDRQRLLSKRHAQVSLLEGSFFLTDTSGNGTVLRQTGVRLPKGEPVRIRDGDAYIMGDFEIVARLVTDTASNTAPANGFVSGGSLIPDDAFLDLDPLKALDQQARACPDIDELINPTAIPLETFAGSDCARIDMENLLLPELVEASVEPGNVPVSPSEGRECPADDFWTRFGAALDMELGGLSDEAREALAIKVAGLLKQSIQCLQQSLRTRSELKNELRLAQTLVQDGGTNPLKLAGDVHHALRMLLRPDKPFGIPADRAIAHAFRDLQAHQVALLCASRAAMRATLEQFSPRQLMVRLEREYKPLCSTSGHYWRAYRRYHHALSQDDDWTERLLARDFARAYEEQVRLISTLQTDCHG